MTHHVNMTHSPPPKLWYLPNHHDALQAHMHLLHKLRNSKIIANYHAYYQTLIKDGTANGATSNAYLTSSNVSLPCSIVQTLNKSNLPPLSTSRQCSAHPFWVPTHKKEHDHQGHNIACRMISNSVLYLIFSFSFSWFPFFGSGSP